MSTAFITGFPGFIARRLLRKLAATRPELRFGLLVQSRLVGRAEDDMAALEGQVPSLRGRWFIVVGDITERQLGLARVEYEELAAVTTEVWHLAALYNLAVEERIAHRVNVAGTRNVLELCEAAPELDRLLHVSTCYVSGNRTGLIREGELDEGQGFKNHYESTKFQAELEVQRRMERLPTTIFRPGIAVGDSRTGETDKYDGPYYIIKLIERLPEALPLINIGRGESRVNLVPIDFVVDAMAALRGDPRAVGRVFHLADPAPMRASAVLDLILETLGRPQAVASIPSLLAESALRLGPLRRAAAVPREVIVYFNHDARYDTTNTQALLDGTGIACPHLSDYMDTLIHYMRKHPKKTFLDGREV